MIAVTVAPGDTLSGIAAEYGLSWRAVYADNPGIANPNLIYVGETVVVPSGEAWTPAPSAPAEQAPSQPAATPAPSAGTTSGGDLSDVPGMPASLASCIAFRESTDGEASSNVYGIIPASGYDVAGDSLAEQQQVAGEIYAADGGVAWAADGCPGT